MGGEKQEHGRFKRDPARVRATVIARWEDDRALLRADEAGAVYSVTVPEGMRGSFDVGVAAWLDLDEAGDLRAWSLEVPGARPAA